MASDKEASLIIRLKDELSGGLGKIKGSIIALGAALTGLVVFLGDSLRSFLEADRAVNKLNAALKTQGVYTAALSGELQRFATELQRQTTFSDEAILSAQALFTTFGLAGSEMKRATQAAVDLSAGLGIDLTTSAMLVGKAFTGSTEMLSRYGIRIAENIPASERFSEVLRQINDRFGGRAVAELDSYQGRIQNLKNRFDDIKEQIGEALIPVLDRGLRVIEFFIGGIERLGGIFPAVFMTGLSVLQEFVVALQLAVQQVPFLGSALGLIGVNFDELNQKIQSQIDKIMLLTQQEQDEFGTRLLNQQQFSNSSNAIEQNRATAKKKVLDKELQDLKKTLDEEVLYNRKVRDQAAKEDAARDETAAFEEQRRRDDRARNFAHFLNHISSLSSSKNKEMAAVGKAAAITQATIDTYAAGTAAYKSLAGIPVVGPVLAAAAAATAIAAGLANVARIRGVQLAEGGIVMPRPGGTLATIGEGGRPEAVIPLDDPEAQETLEGLGGTTVNVIVNGTLIADPLSVQEFARAIDKELFNLRRNRESVAFEAL